MLRSSYHAYGKNQSTTSTAASQNTAKVCLFSCFFLCCFAVVFAVFAVISAIFAVIAAIYSIFATVCGAICVVDADVYRGKALTILAEQYG